MLILSMIASVSAVTVALADCCLLCYTASDNAHPQSQSGHNLGECTNKCGAQF